ncbi:hypothetical protein G205_15060 [Paenarthrobacter nicotinovorans]|nr:hypothetical protein G205_15060 [Paenarthrobacter nicotinovorans]
MFNELERLDSSMIPTWQAQITGADQEDLQALADTLGPRGLGIDEWSGIHMMCSDCSHGSPREGHDHAAPASDALLLGLAGHESDLGELMERWQQSGRQWMSSAWNCCGDRGRTFRVFYNNAAGKAVGTELIPFDEAVQGPQDGLMGAGFVENRLTTFLLEGSE